MKYLILLILLVGCTVEVSDVYGEYTKEHNGIKEVLYIRTDYYYEREIYDNSKNELLFKFKGKWTYDNDAIWFDDFFKSFSSVDLYKKYINFKSKDDRLYGTRLHICKGLSGVYIEETALGKVFSTYVKSKIQREQ